jgi:hypothetical protein
MTIMITKYGDIAFITDQSDELFEPKKYFDERIKEINDLMANKEDKKLDDQYIERLYVERATLSYVRGRMFGKNI